MSRMLNVITLSIVFVEKKNSKAHDLEKWGLGSYMKNMEMIDPNDIFGGDIYERTGEFNLNKIINFKHKFIYYQGDTTFQPCRDSKWFILNMPIYIRPNLLKGFPTKKPDYLNH